MFSGGGDGGGGGGGGGRGDAWGLYVLMGWWRSELNFPFLLGFESADRKLMNLAGLLRSCAPKRGRRRGRDCGRRLMKFWTDVAWDSDNIQALDCLAGTVGGSDLIFWGLD